MFRRKKKATPPPPTGCGHTDEEHREIFRRLLCGEIDDLELEPEIQPEPLTINLTGRPMRGLNAKH